MPRVSPLAGARTPDRTIAAGFVALFFAAWLWAMATSSGFLEADAATHYLIARKAPAEPSRFTDVWGRPVKTLLYAGPAALAGRNGVRTTSLLLAVACAALAIPMARRLGVRGIALPVVFTLGQPLVYLHSFSELTELPFAALLGVCWLLYDRRRHAWLALVAGLLPAARPEGFGFLLLTAGVLVARRRWATLPLLAVGWVMWNYMGWRLNGQYGSPWTWVRDHWPYAESSAYRSGHVLHFVALLPAAVGPGLLPATLVGIAVAARRLRANGPAAAVVAVPCIVLAAHSVLFALGKMASNGELRYLLTAAPFWGALGAAGMQHLFDRLRLGPPTRAAVVAIVLAMVPVFINVQVYRVLPLRYSRDWQDARALTDVLRGRLATYPRIAAAHPGIDYFLTDAGVPASTMLLWDHRTLLEHPPAAAQLLWDPMYAIYNSDRQRIIKVEDLQAAGWIEEPCAFAGWRLFHTR